MNLNGLLGLSYYNLANRIGSKAISL